jgi:hypothetical protein
LDVRDLAVTSSGGVIIEASDNIAAAKLKEKCDGVIEVGELSEESVRALLFPKLTQTEPQLTAVIKLCGNRPGLLKKIAAALDALEPAALAQRAEEDHMVKTKQWRALPADSSKLEIDLLGLMRDSLLEEAGADTGAFSSDFEAFQSAISQVSDACGETTAENPVLGKVFFLESLSQIQAALKKTSSLCLRLPVLDVRHPILVKLIQANLLGLRWQPQPVLTAQSVLISNYLDAYVHGSLEGLSVSQRVQYNLVLLRSRHEIRAKLNDAVILP